MLGHQAAEVLELADGLGGAEGQRAAVARVLGAHRVVHPVQRHAGGAGMARGQPAAQPHQQRGRALQQRGRMVLAAGQFDAGVEVLGQQFPAMRLGPQAVGLVQHRQQGRAEAPPDAAARQRPQLPQRVDAGAAERLRMRAGGAERHQRQRSSTACSKRPPRSGTPQRASTSAAVAVGAQPIRTTPRSGASSAMRPAARRGRGTAAGWPRPP
ncbi:hypothetical protein Ddc_19756 [Ditylenchus destructor]|nr:hypothetical protein Ddc_19756 [Ditylenchus destructor]